MNNFVEQVEGAIRATVFTDATAIPGLEDRAPG